MGSPMASMQQLFVGLAALVAAVSVVAPSASAFEVSPPDIGRDAGQRIFVHGETVSATVLGASGGFDNRLTLDGLSEDDGIACGSVPVGFTSLIGEFDAPTEMVMTLTTPEDNVWTTGPGADSPDAVPHARLTILGDDRVLMEWEDLSGGGDGDYNDCVVELLITPNAAP